MEILFCFIYTVESSYFFYKILKLLIKVKFLKTDFLEKNLKIFVFLFFVIYYALFYCVQLVLLPTFPNWHLYDRILYNMAALGGLFIFFDLFAKIFDIDRHNRK